MRTVYRIASAVAVLGAALPLAAQEPPEAQDAIEQLQSKSALTDEDQAALRTWVQERVQAIVGGDPAGSAEAVQELRARHAGTDAFKNAYTTVAIELIGSAYQRAKRDSAARLIATLNTLNQVPTYGLLIEALGDKRVPVRTTAVIGLRRLRTELAKAGGDVFSQTIVALREAGKRETSPVTLELIYRAMDYTEVQPSPPDPKANAAAVLDLLAARGEQHGARSVRAQGADRPGLKLAGKLSAQLDDQGRQRLIVASAKMLHYAVTRYTSELHKVQDKGGSPLQIALRNRIELFIATAEELLAKLTSPENPPTVAKVMQEKGEGEKTISMKIEMNKWGDLLQERFQFDVHMDVTEDAEASTDDAEGEAPSP